MKKTTFWKSLFLLCALIVGSTSVWAQQTTVTKTMNEIVSANSYTVSSGNSATCYTSFSLDDNITISTSGSANCGSFWGTTTYEWRLYQNKSGDITITAKSGYTLNSVTITYSASNTGTLKDGSTTISSNSAQSISGSSKTYTVGNTGTATNGQVKITQISVTYTQTGSNPTISLSSSNINHLKEEVNDGSIDVTYNNLTNYAADVIFYEADGSTEATYNWLDAEIDKKDNTKLNYFISANTGSKRQAYLKVYALGDEGEAYSPLITITQASGIDTPIFNPVGGTYTTNQDVTISCATENSTIYYTIDGSDPDNTKNVYSAPISITNSGTVLKAIAYTTAGNSEIASATYTIRPIAPTISYVGATVTITGPDGCTLYYTTNGNAPDNNSTKYTGPFDLNADCTIKAVAYDTYNNKGTVKTTNFKYLEISPKNINSGYYEKVTDASTLENGDAILIVYETGNCAMSTTQGSNNRDNTSVTISAQTNPKSIYAPAASVQKLVLVKNTESISNVETDVFYFYTGSGYLYAAGANSNNYLRTSLMPDEKNNSRATISISSGNATIAFQGESTKNHMRYNNSNDQKKFSCYASNSDFPLVQIYKEVVKNQTATISNAKYATFNNATYALDFSGTGISVYTATDNATSVTLNEITSGKVPAGTPVVLYNADVTETTAFNVPVIASADDPEGTNHLVVKDDGADVPNMFVLAKRNNKVGFYKWAGTKLSAGKVYLLGQSNEAREFLGFDDTATGIANVDINANDNFDENAPAYNLAGQRVNATYKGVVIVNGKKIVRK